MTGDPAIDALDLAPDVARKAAALKRACPQVVFTSGRRTIAQQAHAMAVNTQVKRSWIRDTYAHSAASVKLQAWVDAHPGAVTVDAIAAGLERVMRTLPLAELVHLSRHLTGRAFDVQPHSCPVAAIQVLSPALFLQNEGHLVRWHVQF
jgi:hypothetical protein